MGGGFTFHTCLTLAFSHLKNAEKLCFFCSLALKISGYIMKKLSNNKYMYLCRTTELPGDSGWETILGNEDSQQQEV